MPVYTFACYRWLTDLLVQDKFIIKTMVAGPLAMQGFGASVAMVLAWVSWGISIRALIQYKDDILPV